MGKILIIADQGGECCAIPRGLELAARLQREAEVVAFTHAPVSTLNIKPTERERMRKRLLQERDRTLHEHVRKYRARGQKVDLQVVWEKNIQSWINRRCAGGGYDMVIKTGNRTESLVHTSTDWQLLRECPAPVLLVAKKRWHHARPVLAALDLSSKVRSKQALNRKVLSTARDLAAILGVDLEIIAAIEIPTLLADLDLVDPHAYVRDARESMGPRIRKLAAEFDLAEEAFLSKKGPAEKVIVSRAAKVRAQLVVIGTVARKGVRARLLGNTAERVLRNLKTDVIAVKP